MSVIKKRQNVIGRRLLWQSLVAVLGLTLLSTTFQMWLFYNEIIASIHENLQNIEIVQAKGLSTALWNVSTPEIVAQNEGIVNFPFINYAAVYEDDKLITEAGVEKKERIIEKVIPLTFVRDGESFDIGKLYVQANTSEVYNVVLSQVLREFTFQAVTIIVVMMILLILIDRRVTRYLIAAAHYFNNLTEQDNKPLELDKKNSGDEIDSLVDSYNIMRLRMISANRHRLESERKYATLLSNLPGMAFRCLNDTGRSIELVSAGCRELTGYSEAELTGDDFSGLNLLIHPEDREDVIRTVQNGLKESRSFELTYRMYTKDKQEKWVWERGVGICLEHDETCFIEGFIVDITENKQQEREIEAIAAISFALRAASRQDEMLIVILEQTMKLLDANGASIELLDEHKDDVVIKLAAGVYKEFSGMRFSIGALSNENVRYSKQTYLNNNMFGAKHQVYPYNGAVCHAVCGVPMIAHDHCIGYLWIGRMTEISDNAVRALAAIVDIAANAIYRAGLFSKTQQQILELIGLRKIDEAINSSQDLTNILQVLLEQTMDLLKVDAANIILLDEKSYISTFETGMGFHKRGVRKTLLPEMDSYARKACMEQALIKINDIDHSKPGKYCEEIMKREGYKAYFAAPLVIHSEVKGLLQVFLKNAFYPDADWFDYFQSLAGQAAIAVSKAHLFEDLQRSNLELHLAYDETIEGWSNALDLRDKETEGHSQRVTDLTLVLALMMGIKGEELVHIRRGSLLHDIGKMGVPDQILLKPAPLTEEEWVIMRKHPVYAHQLLSSIEYLRPALDIPYCHHEKWDGSGYPRGIKGEEIPLAARIFAIVDVWDALTSDRPYRNALSIKDALTYIKQQSGYHFDPDVVKTFLQVRKERSLGVK